MNSYLRRELFIIAASGCVLLVLLFFVLHPLPSLAHAGQALLQSLLLWAFTWWQGWSLRQRNRTEETTPLLPTLGSANQLTLLRGLLIAACGGFLLLPQQVAGMVPALCYSLAAILDRVDGYVARRGRNITLLGSELDTRVDAIGIVVAPLLAISYGKLHASYLLVSVAYYIFIGGIHWRHTHGLAVLPLRPSQLRRTLAGMQMGFVAFALWPQLQPALTQLGGAAFMLPLLLGFVVDWCVVSGRLPSQTAAADGNFQRVEHFSELVVQPLLRIALVGVLWLGLQPLQATDAADVFTAWHYLLIASSIGLVLGISGRVCAVAVLLFINWHRSDIAFHTVADLLAPVLAVWVLLFGSGRFSVWQGDSSWVNRQDGA